MRLLRFTKTLVVRGNAYPAGLEVFESDLPPGAVASCLRLGHLVEVKPDDKAEAPPPATPKSTPAKK